MAVKTKESRRIADNYQNLDFDSLFQNEGEQPSRSLRLVHPDHIRFAPQVREDIPREEIENRRASIAETRRNGGGIDGTGINQNVILRADPQAPPGVAQYIVVAGEIRVRAAQELERERLQMLANDVPGTPPTPYLVPAVIVAGSEENLLITQLTENVQRRDLTPTEEGRGYLRLQRMGLSIRDICGSVGKTEKEVRNRLMMVSAPPDVQKMTEKRPQSIAAVEQLRRLPTPQERKPFIERLESGEGVAKVARDAQRAVTRSYETPRTEPTPSERRDALLERMRRINSRIASERREVNGVRTDAAALIKDFGMFADGYKRDLRREVELIKQNLDKLLYEVDAQE